MLVRVVSPCKAAISSKFQSRRRATGETDIERIMHMHTPLLRMHGACNI